MKNPKVFVFVKHYLTPEGVEYFQSHWIPMVYAILSQQKGFVSIAHGLSKNCKDCATIFLKFEDEKTFGEWLSHPKHDELIHALDLYRSREFWEAVKTDDEHADPSQLNWTTIRRGS